MLSAAISLLLALSIGLSPLAAVRQSKQDKQDEPIRLKADLIEVRAVVTDKQGNVIGNLKKEDFELLEKGRPQEIGFFSVERVGGRDTGRPSSETNRIARDANAPLSLEATERSVALFVDTMHLSSPSLSHVKRELTKYIDEQMTDEDAVAIVTGTGSLGVLEQFTRDRSMLRYAISKITPWRTSPDSLFTPYLAARVRFGDPDAINVGIEVMKEENPSLAFLPQNQLLIEVRSKANDVLIMADNRRKNLLRTLKAIAERMADMPGQRLMLFISDGFTLMDQGGTADMSDLQSAVSRAVRSGVVIYSMDAKGLSPPAMFNATSRGVSADIRTGNRLASYSSASEKDLQDGMHSLAKDTGGEVFFNTNDLRGAVQKALDGNRVYYSLAYYPIDQKNDKRFRNITVRVKGHPEYIVRAQKGYVPLDFGKEEVAQSPEQQMIKALSSPLPLTAIGVSASADYLEIGNDRAQASLQVHIEGDNLQYREEGDRLLLAMEVLASVYDREGKHVNTYSEVVRGRLTRERVELAKQTGYHYSRRIPLKPGFYQIRVAVRELESERIGTAMTGAEIPDLDKGKLTLSDILLAQTVSEGQKTLKAGGDAKDSITAQKYGIKFYKANSALVYYFMVYNGLSEKKEEGDLLMRSEILKGEDEVFMGMWQPMDSRIMGKDRKGVEVGGQINLALAPGIYQLRIKIKDAKSNKIEQRSVAFGVEL